MSDSRQDYDEVVEILRKEMCTLPRYSFLLNSEGGVSRVEDISGRWIEWDEVHKLLQLERVDWLRAKARGEG